MKKILFFCFIALYTNTHAQFSVRLVVTSVATRQNDDIYLTGNFNGWNPKDENYKLKPFGGSRKSIVLKDMAAGTYAFKFSRGAADKLETTADGRDIPERVIEVNADLSQEYAIAGWKDDYPEVPKNTRPAPRCIYLIRPSGYLNSTEQEGYGYTSRKGMQPLLKNTRSCI